VDKVEKAKHKANTDKFWDWICAVAPLMPVSGNYDTPERVNYDNYNNQMANQAQDWLNDNQPTGVHGRGYNNSFIYGNSKACAEVIKDVMADEEHPLRLPLAWSFVNGVNNGNGYVAYSINLFASVANQQEASKLRAKYNAWINRQLNLVNSHEPSKVLVNH
jgi:hypothetical protein